jgi:hypothetical protein
MTASAGAHKKRHVRVQRFQRRKSLFVVFGVAGDSARAHKMPPCWSTAVPRKKVFYL